MEDMKHAIAAIALLLYLLPTTQAGERDVQIPWCEARGGKTEVRIEGGRIDCLTDRYAIEFDYAYKWKECLAQARWYGLKTGKIPGCVLIVKADKDKKYLIYTEDYLAGTDVYVRVWPLEVYVMPTK